MWLRKWSVGWKSSQQSGGGDSFPGIHLRVFRCTQRTQKQKFKETNDPIKNVSE